MNRASTAVMALQAAAILALFAIFTVEILANHRSRLAAQQHNTNCTVHGRLSDSCCRAAGGATCALVELVEVVAEGGR